MSIAGIISCSLTKNRSFETFSIKRIFDVKLSTNDNVYETVTNVLRVGFVSSIPLTIV